MQLSQMIPFFFIAVISAQFTTLPLTKILPNLNYSNFLTFLCLPQSFNKYFTLGCFYKNSSYVYPMKFHVNFQTKILP